MLIVHKHSYLTVFFIFIYHQSPIQSYSQPSDSEVHNVFIKALVIFYIPQACSHHSEARVAMILRTLIGDSLQNLKDIRFTFIVII